jgi:hypothetical protein
MRKRRGKEEVIQVLRCATCGEHMPPEFWYGLKQAPAPIHCEGSRVAWTRAGMTHPHHGRFRHPACWNCQQSMGCDQCVSSRETICKRCAVYVYPEHLARLGPLLNTPQMLSRRDGLRAPQVADYPAAFRDAYRRKHAACVLACWCHANPADMAIVRKFLGQSGTEIQEVIPEDELARRRRLRDQAQQLTGDD